MILQTDARLNRAINKYGCYFFSILFLGVKHTRYALDCGEILDLYLVAIDNGYMDEDLYIEDPDGIFSMMNLVTRYSGKHESNFYECKKDEIEILRYIHPEGYGHFVAGDGEGHIAFDPMGMSQAVKHGYMASKRIFKLINWKGK